MSVARACFALLAALAASHACAQAAPSSQIYSCVDASGKRLTSDRPIVECNSREQKVLNADGSVKRVQAPPMTGDERTEAEARDRDAAVELAQRQEAVRRDRNLLARFPNEAAHKKARESALELGRSSVRLSQQRLAALATERKPLTDETEFYVGRPMPAKLKSQLDANDATTEAQRSLLQNQQLEIVRIDKLYDAELERLRKLWGGARPGSMGMIAGAASAPRSK
jgi:type I site-specific restriction endonuclease